MPYFDMPKSILKAFAGLAVIVTAACSSTPDPNYYMLSQQQTRPVSSTQFIGLDAVTLPNYARQDKIASLSGPNVITLDDDNRWAEPAEQITAANLARNIMRASNMHVAVRPYPRGLEPAYKVELVFDTFIRGTDGSAQIAGQYFIMKGRQEHVTNIQRFDITVPARSDSYEAYMIAMSSALETLSNRIAQNINAS